MADNVTGLPQVSRMLTIGAQRIAVYESAGKGPAVLLVHGNSASSKVWTRTLGGPLGLKYRLVAIDLPGHGASADADPGSLDVYSLPGYAGVIREVVAQLRLDRPVIVGWSLGGHAVLEAAPSLPQAAGFMIFGTPPLPFPPAADFDGAFLKLGLGFVKDWTPEQAREYVDDFFAPGAIGDEFFLEDALRTDGNARASLAASMGTVGYADEVKIASALRQPLAILHGGDEQIVGLRYLRKLAPAIPALWRGEVQVVKEGGHAFPWESSEEFDVLLDAFVQHCRGG